jgi:predicted metalloprotease
LIGGALLYFGGGLFSGAGSGLTGEQSQGGGAVQGNAAEEEMVQFVSFVLDDAQNAWTQRFAQGGGRYAPARMVIFRGSTRSACGLGQAEMGPFYCPRDQRVYIDLSFYQDLRQRFGAPGDFAQAYVIAHEIGHHVQHLLGNDRKAEAAGQREGAEGGSVRLELQADCFAGLWAHSTQQRDLLEAGDIDEALRAAAAIGDDRLQRSASGTVTPETWTHGSSEQRARWFKRGYQSGQLEACDTFSAGQL